MSATDPRRWLAGQYRTNLVPFVSTLLDRYRQEAEYDVRDFPLIPAEFERFRERLLSSLTACLGCERWRIRAPLTRQSPIADLFAVETLGRTVWQGVGLEASVLVNHVTGDRVPAVLCLPAGVARRPAVAVFSGHSDHGLNDLVLDSQSYQRALALRLARAGFVTLAVEKIDSGYLSRAFHAGQDGGDDENSAATFLLACGSPGVAARQVMISICALEFLAGHPGVNEKRIGTAGVSFGGWSAVYAALLSDRAAAVADFGRKTQLIDLHPGTFQGVADFSHLFPGLSALGQRNLFPLALAPRPLSLGHGQADAESDRQGFHLFHQPLLEQYRMLGAAANLDYHQHAEGDVMPEAHVLQFFQHVFGS